MVAEDAWTSSEEDEEGGEGQEQQRIVRGEIPEGAAAATLEARCARLTYYFGLLALLGTLLWLGLMPYSEENWFWIDHRTVEWDPTLPFDQQNVGKHYQGLSPYYFVVAGIAILLLFCCVFTRALS